MQPNIPQLGVALAFLLLVAAVWVADVSAATGLAATAGLILLAVGGLVMTAGQAPPPDDSDRQRERMRETTP